MRGAEAYVQVATEDFGIATAEAQACGTPVIAFGRGGAAEIVQTGEDGRDPTGELFWQQNEAGVVRGVKRFLARRERIEREACRANAERFSAERFRKELAGHVEQVLAAAVTGRVAVLGRGARRASARRSHWPGPACPPPCWSGPGNPAG